MKAMAMVGLAMMVAVPAPAANPVETPDAKALREARNFDTLLKYYPPRALAAREQGLVAFKLSIDRAGHPTACEVTHSSGHRRLDNETCQLILSHAVLKPLVDSDGNRKAHVTEGVINWKIPGSGATALVAPVKVSASNAPEKMICKRELKTGTLADYERTCMTRREWKRLSDQMKEPWEEIKRNASTMGN